MRTLARSIGVLVLGSVAPAKAEADSGPSPSRRVTIERATVPWSDLERLLRSEGKAPARRASEAPRAFAVRSAEVDGEIEGGRVSITLRLTIDVLADAWTVIPMLPVAFAVAHGEVSGPSTLRGILVRDGAGVSLAAEGAGVYDVAVAGEGPLERIGVHQRLSLGLSAPSTGRARFVIRGGGRVSGATGFRARREASGALLAEATLGARGVELILDAEASAPENAPGLENLEVTTVLAASGAGVTRLVVDATPVDGAFELTLPRGARLLNAFAGARSCAVAAGEKVRLPLRVQAPVEIAFTFETAALGIRGRYRLELPSFTKAVRQARWVIYLPDGLTYRDAQSTLPSAGAACPGTPGRARVPLSVKGHAVCYAGAVLGEGPAFAEGLYSQGL